MINHRPLHPTMGSMVIGKRLTDFTNDDFKVLKKLILERRAIFFENQFLTRGEIALVSYKLQSPNGRTHISEVDNAIESEFMYGFDWHSDKIFSEDIPLYTLFQMNYLPDNTKGGTEFLDSVNFFEESFSPAIKELLLKLYAVFEHRIDKTTSATDEHISNEVWSRATHEVILHTPKDDGKVLRSMSVNPCNTAYIVGCTNSESTNIIRCIVDTMYRQSKFKYKHQWKEGDLVIWSNRVCQHRAIKDFSFGFNRNFIRSLIF